MPASLDEVIDLFEAEDVVGMNPRVAFVAGMHYVSLRERMTERTMLLHEEEIPLLNKLCEKRGYELVVVKRQPSGMVDLLCVDVRQKHGSC